ncbi:MAG: dethiobiotin synthase [Bacteroidota bacterium]
MTSFADKFPDRFVVVGIDTDAGKTVVAALLCLGLEADYWKPVQAGREPMTDTGRVREITGLPEDHFHPEAYCLAWPASPHAAAAQEGIRIAAEKIVLPVTPRKLVIEGAGGLMVPLREDYMYLDLLAEWKLPVVLVVRTYLGSINHSLLSIAALRRNAIPILGLVFNEGGRPESEGVIERYSGIEVLGGVPELDAVNAETLRAVWRSWSAPDQ